VNERADAELSGPGAFDDLVEGGAVTETNRGSRAKDQELPDEVARQQLILLPQHLLELPDAGERPAVRQFAGRVHRQAEVKGEEVPVFSPAGNRSPAFVHGAVLLAPAAHDIEALERETRGIHLAVA